MDQKRLYCWRLFSLCLSVSSQPPSKALSSILGKSNLQFAGMSINLNISTSSLNLMTPDGKQVSKQPLQTRYRILPHGCAKNTWCNYDSMCNKIVAPLY